MISYSDKETDTILENTDDLFEDILAFIQAHPENQLFDENDQQACEQYLEHLTLCLSVLESLHASYRDKLLNSKNQHSAINQYARTMALSSAQATGDISHAT